MKCANCGNTDKRFLFDEDDTFYCSKCTHRTQKATGQDDLITCPYCGRLRDRKAFLCMWCGNSIGAYPPPSKEDYEELNESVTEFEKTLNRSHIRYWKLLKMMGKVKDE